jgi:hypothetical protein
MQMPAHTYILKKTISADAETHKRIVFDLENRDIQHRISTRLVFDAANIVMLGTVISCTRSVP